MSTNMELIEAKTLGSNTSGVTFSSIPQTYTDLKLVYSARNTTSAAGEGYDATISFNGTTANRVTRVLRGDGSGVAVNTISDPTDFRLLRSIQPSDYTSSIFSNVEIYLPNYTSSDYKLFSVDTVLENNATATGMGIIAGQWSDTAAITSITLGGTGGNLLSGSTFYLYGISNVTSTTKATGGIVSSDGTYNYHMFPYSGTFTPTQSISADVLCIAGGGGSSYDRSGGGGAGGLLYSSSQSLTTTAYTITIGGGGAGAATNTTGSSGGNTTISGSGFTTLTAVGGGYGAQGGQNGANGGSGGGSGTGGTGTAGQGNNGGTGGSAAPNYGAGAGGGAGAAGDNGTSTFGGNGGNGVNTYSSWANATQTGVNGYYAGGGGGGTYQGGTAGSGGLGGGGAAGAVSANSTGTAGIANTGGGAGGSSTQTNGAPGASGGSGLVIIRYAI